MTFATAKVTPACLAAELIVRLLRMIQAIIDYFAKDPLRILYAIGGSGGLWFWIVRWRGRVRLDVLSIDHIMPSLRGADIDIELRFEVENLGDSPTAIKPTILVVGVDKDRRVRKGELRVSTLDRRLEPHSPKDFTATGQLDATYPFWMFKRYRVAISKGRNSVVRFRSNPNSQRLDSLTYFFESTLYRTTGSLPFVK